MKSLFSLLFGMSLLVGSTILAHAQIQIPRQSDAEELTCCGLAYLDRIPRDEW